MNITGGRLGVIVGTLVGVSSIILFGGSPERNTIVGVVTLLLTAFLWLAWETQWFTIRLPYGKPAVIGTADYLIKHLLPILVATAVVIGAFKYLSKLLSVPAWRRATVTDPITRKSIQVDRRTGRIL